MAGIARNRLKDPQTLQIAGLVSVKQISWGSAMDTLAGVAEKGAVFRNGRWETPSLFFSEAIDFGPPHGTKRCYSFPMPELMALPLSEWGVTDAGFYEASFNKMIDSLFLLWKVLRLYKTRLGTWIGTRLVQWSQVFFHPPYLVMVQLRATTGGDARREYTLQISEPDPYRAVAIPLVACIRQLMDRRPLRRRGLHFMSDVIDIERCMADLEAMGMTVSHSERAIG